MKEPASLQSMLAGAKPEHEKRASYENKHERELDFLARTIFGEARGSNRTAKELVAWQIRNRVEYPGKTFPKSYEDVVMKGNGKEYNCWLPPTPKHPNPNYDRAMNPPTKSTDLGWKEWVDSVEAAKTVMDASADANPIKGAVFYYSPKAQAKLAWKDPSNNPLVPPWAFPENKLGDAKGADFEFYRAPYGKQVPESWKRSAERIDWRKTLEFLRKNPDLLSRPDLT